MARTWSGFLPQNESVKQQWTLIEAPPNELADFLHKILRDNAHERSETGVDEEQLISFRSTKPGPI
jgi:hypothetical protein